VTMDGYELFSGTVSLPPAAFLGFAPLREDQRNR